jgi:hypothetical protein
MTSRLKFQVWSEKQNRWRTVYVRSADLMANVTLLRGSSIKFRIGGDRAGQ